CAVHASPSKFQFFGDQVHAEQFAVCTDLFQHAQNVAVAAADFQDSVARRQPSHNLPNETAEDGVAGAKPEVSVFRVEQEWCEVRQTFGDSRHDSVLPETIAWLPPRASGRSRKDRKTAATARCAR